MIKIAILGVLVGIDNLQVVAGLALFNIEQKRKYLMVMAFAFFETIMPLIGLLAGQQLQAYTGEATEWLGPLILFVLGSSIIILELLGKESSKVVNQSWMIIGLPLMMSLDNLFAGVGLGTMGYPVLLSALIIGVCSACLSFVGLFLGEKISSYLPKRAELLSGSYLIGLALFFLLLD